MVTEAWIHISDRWRREREAFTCISRHLMNAHSIFIGRKIQAIHSPQNQTYNLPSRSDDWTWGVTGLNRSYRVRSFIGLTNQLVQPPIFCIFIALSVSWTFETHLKIQLFSELTELLLLWLNMESYNRFLTN